MTVSPITLDTLSEGVIFLQEKGFLISCNLAYGIDWSDESFCRILERELGRLIEYYLVNPDMPICSMLDMGIERISFTNNSVHRYCGAGIDMIAYDVDGKSYPCQMFMPLSAGTRKAAAANSIQFYEDTIPINLVDPKCFECVIRSVCPTCYGSNYISTGNIYIHDSSFCSLMKIIMKARSYLKGKLWESNRLHLSPQEELYLLESISILQSEL